jgi:hypothetical protein
MDMFGGPRGPVVYPQYSWKIATAAGTCSGFGFAEVAPREPFFTNHLAACSLSKAPWFSVHAEIGGQPNASPRLGFFQVGPRLNVHEVIPGLKKPLHHLIVAALPRFIGIRPNNLLLAGATNKFQVTRGLDMSIEGFRRIFPGRRPDYAEYTLLAHPWRSSHISFAAFAIHDGSRIVPAFGLRVRP